MLHFYDGQIRRYITQIVRVFSNFSHKDIDGNIKKIPVVYGDLARQVGSILKDNSELKILSVPKMSVYITNLEMDRQRTGDSTFVRKTNLVEREYDSATKEYNNKKGKGYTVEKLMPSPYTLSVNVDIWSSNTDQKLQILEQILMLFNPSLEIQTTDNFIDWTSLSVLNLDQINFSSRSIGASTESEIDIASLTLSTPIYISMPVKVKKLGIIHQIITSIFNESANNVDLNLTMPELLAYSENRFKSDAVHKIVIDENGNEIVEYGDLTASKDLVDSVVATTVGNFDLLVLGTTIKLLDKTKPSNSFSWIEYFLNYPEQYVDNITEIRLYQTIYENDIIGTVSINPKNAEELFVTWDIDSLPTDSIISGPTGYKTKIDFIIDPTKTNPENLKFVGLRLILLDSPLGDLNNTNGPNGWKNNDNTDFYADINDIVEWDGSKWVIVFDASEHVGDPIYTTNLNTNVQYKFINNEWVLSYEGEYPNGSWRIQF